MPDIPRLNGVIKALEEGQTAFVAFTPVDVESAVAMAASLLRWSTHHSISLACDKLSNTCSTAVKSLTAPLSPLRLRRWCGSRPTVAR